MIDKPVKNRIFERVLRLMAKVVLLRQKPFIIGITGSVGKTTAKDMITHILSAQKTVWSTRRNYNNEIGVPLTILGINRDVNSFAGVLFIIYRWIYAVLTTEYPEILVIEMGVDRPYDMDYLMGFVKPDIAVLTAISYAHSEFFDSIKEIIDEKQKLIILMKSGGTAVINYDDKNVRTVMQKTNNHIISYGTMENADVTATDIELCFRQCHTTGLSFKLNYKGKMIPVRLHNICARHMVYATLAALAVADVLHINIIEAVNDIADVITSPGRMRLLEGKNDVLVIDDTYNASPKAMQAAIDTLGSAPAHRKIAVLGDMRELGKCSVKEHQKVAKYVRDNDINVIFYVGNEMHHAYIISRDEHKECYHFIDVTEAIDTVSSYVEQGDIVLVKGSRGIHMEKIVRAIVHDPSQAL